MFKKLYKNSGREKGTLRFFREKLNRRNVTVDVKHYEDCEQLFYSVGKCFAVEALLEFFQMVDTKHKPTANGPHGVDAVKEDYQKTYIGNVIDKFLDEFVFLGDDEVTDGIWCYGVNLIKCFLILADFKDAVSTGNGDHLLILRKQLLIHFFWTPGFNDFAIEMLVNILQCEVLLSETEAKRCKWAATVNWKGGSGKNIEIDLFQEDRNCEMKKLIKSMGANKTEKAITRGSKASGAVSKIVEAYQHQVQIHLSQQPTPISRQAMPKRLLAQTCETLDLLKKKKAEHLSLSYKFHMIQHPRWTKRNLLNGFRNTKRTF